MWVLLTPPRFVGAKSCKRLQQSVSTSINRLFRFMAQDTVIIHPSAEASLCARYFPEAATVPGGHRSLRHVPLLVARTAGARSPGAASEQGRRRCACQRDRTDQACDAKILLANLEPSTHGTSRRFLSQMTSAVGGRPEISQTSPK